MSNVNITTYIQICTTLSTLWLCERKSYIPIKTSRHQINSSENIDSMKSFFFRFLFLSSIRYLLSKIDRPFPLLNFSNNFMHPIVCDCELCCAAKVECCAHAVVNSSSPSIWFRVHESKLIKCTKNFAVLGLSEIETIERELMWSEKWPYSLRGTSCRRKLRAGWLALHLQRYHLKEIIVYYFRFRNNSTVQLPFSFPKNTWTVRRNGPRGKNSTKQTLNETNLLEAVFGTTCNTPEY